MYYLPWKRLLAEHVELIPIELPGRGIRYNEPCYPSFQEAANDLYNKVANQISDAPFAFFGHSMGALLAYELSCMLKDRRMREPMTLFISGRWPPHIYRKDYLDPNLSDEELKIELIELGGTSPESFENKQFEEMLISLVRADFQMLSKYVYRYKTPLDTALNVMTGNSDHKVNQRDLLEWRNHTNGSFSIHKFNGGHFYITESFDAVMQHINRTLMEAASNT